MRRRRSFLLSYHFLRAEKELGLYCWAEGWGRAVLSLGLQTVVVVDFVVGS